jgi:hypothetical protein
MNSRLQHFVLCVLVVLCGWILFFIGYRQNIKEFHLDTIRQGLLHHARLAEVLFELSSSTPDAAVDAVRERIPYRIEIISARGRVLADSLFSGEDLERHENQLDRKEVVEATEEGQGSDLRYYEVTRGWFLYVAVPLTTGGFIRLSTPVSGSEPLPDTR